MWSPTRVEGLLTIIRRKSALVGLAASVLCASAPAAVPAEVGPQGDAAGGKQIYLRVACFTCHGRFGQGGIYRGPAPILARTALPFDGFRALLRDPPGDMPAYPEAVLSDGDIADLYAFLESLPGPRSPKDISSLNN
ncbi:MAG TPA: cytochrome c [Roseiarcus sp.]|nr:cytochrome c [Roseiarcus sp.]